MTLWAAVGWAGNTCFLARSLVQWLVVEKTGSSRAPVVFWMLSLVGSALAGAYAAHRGLAVLFAGFMANGILYLRNLQIQVRPQACRLLSVGGASCVAVVATVVLLAAGFSDLYAGLAPRRAWVVIAALGQAVWSSRFVLQWWYSERSGESHFPVSFWTVSLVGNVLLLAYAAALGDPVFIAGLALGPVAQIRNLVLARRRVGAVAPAPSHSPVQPLAVR